MSSLGLDCRRRRRRPGSRQPEGLSEAKTFGLPALPRRKRKLRKAGGPRDLGRLFLTRLKSTVRGVGPVARWRHQHAPHPEETWQPRHNRSGPNWKELSWRPAERGVCPSARGISARACRDPCPSGSVTRRGGLWRKWGRGLEGWDSGGAPGGGAGGIGETLMEGPGRGRDPGGMSGLGRRGLCRERGPD